MGHRAAGDVISRKWRRVERVHRQTDWQTPEENPSLSTRSTAAQTRTLKLKPQFHTITHRDDEKEAGMRLVYTCHLIRALFGGFSHHLNPLSIIDFLHLCPQLDE